MARNRTLAIEGEYTAARPEGPLATIMREAVIEYVRREGGLAVVEMAARGALHPSMFAILKLALDLEQANMANKPAALKPRVLSAVPKSALDGPLLPQPHVRQ
jgi:hypothetical protein